MKTRNYQINNIYNKISNKNIQLFWFRMDEVDNSNN